MSVPANSRPTTALVATTSRGSRGRANCAAVSSAHAGISTRLRSIIISYSASTNMPRAAGNLLPIVSANTGLPKPRQRTRFPRLLHNLLLHIELRPPQKKVGCDFVSIVFLSTFSWTKPSDQIECVMNDNPRTQQIYFLISALLLGAAVLFEIGSFVYILRHPPNNPVLLGESSVGTTTARALGLPQ